MSRFRKSDWLELGWTQLSETGPDGLKIDTLCARCGRSKGSFYHHFKDFGVFLSELTDLWVKRQTTDLMAAFDPTKPVQPQMDAMVEQIIAMDYRFELGIRELARRDPLVEARLKDVDRMRMDFTAQIYQLRFGVDADEAARMAELEYAVLNGLFVRDPDISAERQIALYQTYEELLTAKYGKDRQ